MEKTIGTALGEQALHASSASTALAACDTEMQGLGLGGPFPIQR